MDEITLTPESSDFADTVEEMNRSNLRRCWHCLCCSGGCPFVQDMDILPNRIIRMVQMGRSGMYCHGLRHVPSEPGDPVRP